MTTKPGHEHHWHCEVCGLPICPDCDTEGVACSPTECAGWAEEAVTE